MLKYKDNYKANYKHMMDQDEAQKKILQQASIEVSPQMQNTLNQPLGYEGNMEGEDTKFLQTLITLIEKKQINLYQPGSLINSPVYDKLSKQDQAKAEMDAYNMLATIREIYRLSQSGGQNTYQMENLVHKIRTTKERLEEIGGDIFIV
jgi:hypothetical protein